MHHSSLDCTCQLNSGARETTREYGRAVYLEVDVMVHLRIALFLYCLEYLVERRKRCEKVVLVGGSGVRFR